jgi:hypothetical protein
MNPRRGSTQRNEVHVQETDRRRRVAYYLLGRAHARRERLREMREIADACALADLQDRVAEAEAVELMTEEDER